MNTEKELIALTNSLIKILSTSDSKKNLNKVIEFATEDLSNVSIMKFSSQEIPSVLVSNTPKAKSFKVILNAHLDVVPGKSNQFKPVIKGDKLYGRGVYDMKAAAAVMIQVFNDIANKVSYPLALQLVTDEETGGFHGTKYQIEKGVRADFVISGEPTNFDIKYQAKGIVWLKIDFVGKSAHAAYPWDGDNAIEQASVFINKVTKQFKNPASLSWKTTINIASIESANKTLNKIPDSCSVSLDIRFIPEDEKTIIKKITSLLPNNATHTVLTYESAHFTDKSHPFIKTIQKSAHSELAKSPKLISAMGASDLRHYSKIGIPGIEFGPVGNGHHTDNEWVSIKSLNQYYEILKKTLLALDKGKI